MTEHHYTKTAIETVTAAVNAGVCLEDARTENNTLSLAGEAVKQVRKTLIADTDIKRLCFVVLISSCSFR